MTNDLIDKGITRLSDICGALRVRFFECNSIWTECDGGSMEKPPPGRVLSVSRPDDC